MTTYTIRTRGLIPVILKRGPMSGIELDASTLVELLSRGVDIVNDATGKQVQMMDVVAPKKEAPVTVEIPPQQPVNMPLPEEVKDDLKKEAEPTPPVEEPKPVPEEDGIPEPIAEDDDSSDDEPEAEKEPAEDAIPEAPKAVDPYAGMSKNQRKKARAAAAAAAKAGESAGTQN